MRPRRHLHEGLKYQRVPSLQTDGAIADPSSGPLTTSVPEVCEFLTGSLSLPSLALFVRPLVATGKGEPSAVRAQRILEP